LKPGDYNLTEEVRPGYMAVESISNPFTLGCSNITGKNFTNLYVIASINLKKYTNGQDADNVPGPYIQANGSVTWRYVVTSASNVPLQNITVTDSVPGVVPAYVSGDNNSDSKLDPNETWIYEATGTAALGQYENVGNVTGKSPINQTVTDDDTSHYFGQKPSISIVTTTNLTDNDLPPGLFIPVGDTVTWTYTVNNTGNVNLSNVTVVDDQGVTVTYVSGDTNGDGFLNLTETWIFHATGTATEGQYTNLGSVTGTPPVGPDVSDSNPDNYFGQKPGISMVKTTNLTDNDLPPGLFIPVGDTVTWTYTVNNTGNVNLSNVTVVDDHGVIVNYVSGDTNGDGFLNLTETWIFQATGTATAGQYTNLGSVTGTPPVGPDVSDSNPDNYFGQQPGISMVKTTNLTDNDLPPGLFIPVGDTVTWTYTVNNTGNVNLSNVTVVDDQGVTVTYVSGDTNGDGFLNLTETWIFQATGTATAGQYTNLGSVTGTPPTGPDVSDSNPDNYFGQQPSISIVTTTNLTDNDLAPGLFVPVGDTVTWTYTVNNTGNVNLSNVTVVDDQGVTVTYVSGDTNGDGYLNLTETWIFQASGSATAGQYTNLGSVTGTPPTGPDVSDSNPDNYFGQQPSISMVKTTNSNDYDLAPGLLVPVGDTVTWTYTVTNTGNVNLSNVTVVDNKGVTVTYVSGDTNGDGFLNLTETWIFQATGTATAGQYTNLGSVTGTPPVGPDVSDSNPDNYFGQQPGISIVTTTNLTDNDLPPGLLVPVGDTVTWTYTVNNTGNVNLSNVTVVDDKGVTVTYVSGDTNGDGYLNLTETWIFQATGTATVGQYTNLGSVTGTPPIGPDVSDSNPDNYSVLPNI
jgi:large repetitive protein